MGLHNFADMRQKLQLPFIRDFWNPRVIHDNCMYTREYIIVSFILLGTCKRDLPREIKSQLILPRENYTGEITFTWGGVTSAIVTS